VAALTAVAVAGRVALVGLPVAVEAGRVAAAGLVVEAGRVVEPEAVAPLAGRLADEAEDEAAVVAAELAVGVGFMESEASFLGWDV
jgi:hypothetical protein